MKEKLLGNNNSVGADYNVGDTYTAWAGAPGVGKWTYEITRVEPNGDYYGVETGNTVRVLEPWECK